MNKNKMLIWALLTLDLLVSVYFNYKYVNDYPMLNAFSVIGFIVWLIATAFVFVKEEEDNNKNTEVHQK